MDPTTETVANVERPTQVTQAVLLLFISLAIGQIKALFALGQRASGSTLIFACLIVVAFFLLGFVLVWRISLRGNWARIILLVLVLINLPFAVLANIQELRQSVGAGVASIVIEAILWIGTYLLFTKHANAWFRSRK